jgi:hypothetical protein
MRELLKYDLIPDVRTGTLDVRQPALLPVGGNERRIVARRPHGEVDAAGTQEPDEIEGTDMG